MQDTPRTLVIDNRRPGGWWRHLARVALAGIGLALCSGALAAALVYTTLAHDLPRLDAFDRMQGVGVTRFEAADGSLVGERYTERRLALTWEELPRPLILAFLAAEDARFFEHSGIDLRGIVRAMVTNLVAGGVREGASTITQQLAKILVGNERSWGRKIKEAILARRMEDLYSKEQILTWYINTIYYGHHSYGVQAAAQNYFRKNVWELSLGEMALLAGSVQSPSRVNPALDLAAASRRAGHILDNMVELGWVERAAAEVAKAERPVVYPLRDLWGDQVPEYTEAVRRVGARWDDGARGFLERGLTIRMAVDPAAQRVAQAALDEALVALQEKQGYPGPLGRAVSEGEREAFFAKNARWVARVTEAGAGEAAADAGRPRLGARVLGRVAEVSDKLARVELSAAISGVLHLKDASWATPWTTFPRDAEGGRRDTSGKVSFAGKLRALDEALAVGDVVLVEVVEPPPPPKPKKPTRSKKGKKSETEVVQALPEPPRGLHFALSPVPMMEGVIVSTPLEAGGIDALKTGWDFDRSEIDRTLSKRPTGSTMKPLAYALAYDLGLPPSAVISAADYNEDRYTVRGKDALELPVWSALVASDNAVSVRVFAHALDRVEKGGWQRWGERLGLPPCAPPRTPGGEPVCPLRAHVGPDKREYLAEVFGADQRPRDMLSVYGTFARAGRRPALELVRKVVARDGRVLERNYRPVDAWASLGDALIALHDAAKTPVVPMIAPSTAHLVAKNLAAAVASGTGRNAKKAGREAAGKTGTLPYDVWFSGFTGARATVAWLGADDNERTLGPSVRDNKIYGSTAATMWAAFMRGVDRVDKGDAPAGVADVVPPEIVSVAIDPVTGLLAAPGAPATAALTIPHMKGTEPTEAAPEPDGIETLGTLEKEF